MEYIFHVHKEDSECFHSGGIQKGSRKEASASILEASRKDPENKQVLSFWRHPERVQKISKCFHSGGIQKGSRKEASAFILEASQRALWRLWHLKPGNTEAVHLSLRTV